MNRRYLMCVVAAGLAVASAPSLAADKVGVAAAVQNNVQGVQNGAPRRLATGSSVFEQELIRTGEQSVAQLLFLDETTLSIGPLSEVILDRFVYDPANGTGNVVLSATKGAFRFISGSQDPLNYTIETPVATIGVRGTIIDCAIGSLTCIVQQGSVVIVVGGVPRTFTAGDTFSVDDGGTVTGPYQHDGVFDAASFGTTWPLFGGLPPTESWRIEVPDGSPLRIGDIVPPPTVEEGCEGEACE